MGVMNGCDNEVWSPTNYTTWVVEHVEHIFLSFILFSMIGQTPLFVVNQLSHGPILVLEDINI